MWVDIEGLTDINQKEFIMEYACTIDKSKIKLLNSKIIIDKEQYKVVVEFEYEEVNSIIILSLHHTFIDEIVWAINACRKTRITKGQTNEKD